MSQDTSFYRGILDTCLEFEILKIEFVILFPEIDLLMRSSRYMYWRKRCMFRVG